MAKGAYRQKEEGQIRRHEDKFNQTLSKIRRGQKRSDCFICGLGTQKAESPFTKLKNLRRAFDQ